MPPEGFYERRYQEWPSPYTSSTPLARSVRPRLAEPRALARLDRLAEFKREREAVISV